MGAKQSTIVVITPQYFDKDYKAVTHVEFKPSASYVLSKDDTVYLFGDGVRVMNHTITDGKLIYELSQTKKNYLVKDAWWTFTNAGNPVKATFLKTPNIFFKVRRSDVTFKRA